MIARPDCLTLSPVKHDRRGKYRAIRPIDMTGMQAAYLGSLLSPLRRIAVAIWLNCCAAVRLFSLGA
jgi:hypothetical protein